MAITIQPDVIFYFFIFDQGLIIKILSSDKSYITSFILVLFFVISMHCFYHTFIISDELNKAHIIKKVFWTKMLS